MENDEIVRRLDELRNDFKEFREHYVRIDTWEQQRQAQGERFGRYDKDLAETDAELKDLRKEIDGIKTTTDNRFRQAVQIGVVSLLGFGSSLALFIIQLVGK